MSDRRHRASEPLAPRPRDLIADRLRVLASFTRRTGAVAEIGGERLDADALDRVASAQELAEVELLARWRRFRDYYVSYTDVLREREKLLRDAVEWFERHESGPESRRALRLCKLHRPPLAKVRAFVEARAAGT